MEPRTPFLRNIKLIIEYDGTNYHGWQTQAAAGRPTVQESLETAISRVTGTPVRTASSGRTDAGVHALGHVANFLTESRLPAEAWMPVLNRLLPPDIRVQLSEEVPPDFHARRSASGKIYRYSILNRPGPPALERDRAWHVDRPLKVRSMREAAKHLIGRHDFSAFRASSCNAASPVRTLRALDIRKRGDRIEISLEADAFLMHMARNIVGTLVETGLGRFGPDDVKRMLRSRDRRNAGMTAPASGLCLVTVFYGPERPARRPRVLKS